MNIVAMIVILCIALVVVIWWSIIWLLCEIIDACKELERTNEWQIRIFKMILNNMEDNIMFDRRKDEKDK